MSQRISKRLKIPKSRKHPFKIIEFKPNQFAEIDVKMIPLVEWMNSLPATETQFCCQGYNYRDPDLNFAKKPYISFCCKDDATLGMIIRKLKYYVENCECSYDDKYDEEWYINHDGVYTFRFHSTKSLKEMNREMFDFT